MCPIAGDFLPRQLPAHCLVASTAYQYGFTPFVVSVGTTYFQRLAAADPALKKVGEAAPWAPKRPFGYTDAGTKPASTERLPKPSIVAAEMSQQPQECCHTELDDDPGICSHRTAVFEVYRCVPLQAAKGCPDFAPFMDGLPEMPLQCTKSVGAPLHQCQTARHWLLAVHLTCIYVAAKNVEVHFPHRFRALGCYVIFLARLRMEVTGRPPVTWPSTVLLH